MKRKNAKRGNHDRPGSKGTEESDAEWPQARRARTIEGLEQDATGCLFVMGEIQSFRSEMLEDFVEPPSGINESKQFISDLGARQPR